MVTMEEGFGRKTDLVAKNHAEADAVKVASLTVEQNLIVVSDVSKLLAVLKNGRNAVYLPAGKSVTRTYTEKLESPLNFELICVNNGEPEDDVTEVGPEYRPLISLEEPIVFRSGNSVLIDLIALCRGMEDLTDVFTSGFMWLYRIRCAWVVPARASPAARANANVTTTAERLLNASANNGAVTGRRASTPNRNGGRRATRRHRR